jgi:small subunit ribosomal protein S21
MARIKVRNNESFESALKRFNREVIKAGILKELRDREHYQKPSEVRRKLQKERVRKYTLTGSKKHK